MDVFFFMLRTAIFVRKEDTSGLVYKIINGLKCTKSD